MEHLEERYLDIMIDGMSRVTNSDVTFNIILQEDVEELKKKEKEIVIRPKAKPNRVKHLNKDNK